MNDTAPTFDCWRSHPARAIFVASRPSVSLPFPLPRRHPRG